MTRDNLILIVIAFAGLTLCFTLGIKALSFRHKYILFSRAIDMHKVNVDMFTLFNIVSKEYSDLLRAAGLPFGEETKRTKELTRQINTARALAAKSNRLVDASDKFTSGIKDDFDKRSDSDEGWVEKEIFAKAEQVRKAHPDLRYGQAVFVATELSDNNAVREAAKVLYGTAHDPYYSDSVVPEFVKSLAKIVDLLQS